MDDKILNDTELDTLLAHASEPRLSDGFNDRLMQRLLSEAAAVKPVSNNVIPFPARKPVQQATPWFRAVPLAASLAAALVGGLYIGAADNLPSFLPDSSSVASIDDSDQTGFEELDTILQDGQT